MNAKTPWTYTPQQGSGTKVIMAQVWDSDGDSLAIIDPTDDPSVASAIAKVMSESWQSLPEIKPDIVANATFGIDFHNLYNLVGLQRWALKQALIRCNMQVYPKYTHDWKSASGDCVCEKCGHIYYDHPSDWRDVGKDGLPYLKVICDGTRVKL